MVVPSIRGLRSEIKDLQKKFQCKMVNALASSIDKRLSKYESQELFTPSAAPDPRWKLLWCTPEHTGDLRKVLIDKVSTLLPVDPVTPAQSDCFSSKKKVQTDSVSCLFHLHPLHDVPTPRHPLQIHKWTNTFPWLVWMRKQTLFTSGSSTAPTSPSWPNSTLLHLRHPVQLNEYSVLPERSSGQNAAASQTQGLRN